MFDVTNTHFVITLGDIIAASLMYAIVRSIWWVIKRAEKRVQTKASKIIRTHYKSGHNGRPVKCDDGECATLGSVVSVVPQIDSDPGHFQA